MVTTTAAAPVKVGADMAGLAGYHTILSNKSAVITHVTADLQHVVTTLVHDTGWYGDAAQNFKAEYLRAEFAAAALGAVVGSIGDIVGTLHDELTKIQDGLRPAADIARRNKVPLDQYGDPPASSWPPPPPSPQDIPSPVVAAEQDYLPPYQMAQYLAGIARSNAATRLNALLELLVPSDVGGQGTGLSPSNAATGADILRSFYAIPGDKAGDLRRPLKGLEEAKNKATGLYQAAQRAHGDVVAKAGPTYLAKIEAVAAFKAAGSELEAQAKLADKLPGSREAGGDFGELLTKIDPRLGPLGEKIPKLGLGFSVALAGVGTYYQAQTDMQEGWSPAEAYYVDGAANGTGLVVAVATGPAGFIAGPLVQNFIYDYWTEDWSKDYREHGPVVGEAYGIGHTVVASARDTWNIIPQTKNSLQQWGQGVWGWVTGSH